ncbi:MAG: hypothetical protein KA715_08665 [Xanthomonadaceae bacterium]|nr:hypothetical protein [Xanthomonadaceae bacterium]
MIQLLSLTALLFQSWAWSAHTDFAIYDPIDHKDGVWSAETRALEPTLKKMGYTVKIIGDSELLSLPYSFDALIQPGGYGTERVKRIGELGFKNIRKFVKSGHGYVGFCAGSYLATQNWDWAQESTRQGGKLTDPDDYTEYRNPSIASLFLGWAVGPFAWHPWNGGTTPPSMEPVKLFGKQSELFYYGGPYFDFSEKPEGLEVWARAIAPKGTPSYALEADGQPTIVKFNLGDGDVVLSSYHPVFTIKNGKREVSTPNSTEWKLLLKIFSKSLGK